MIAPPLKGPSWVAGGGCCAPPSYHRGATLPLNGAIHVAERFAIDFVQLNDKNMLITGRWRNCRATPISATRSIRSPTARWSAPQDGLPGAGAWQAAGGRDDPDGGGNHVVVDIGEGRFAFYAHMQPGSCG